jgi:ATP-dependent DNA helicase RecG
MDRIASTLKYCEEPRSLKEIMVFLKLRHRENFMEKVLHPLIDAGLIERTIPDKPRSRLQKYISVKKN